MQLSGQNPSIENELEVKKTAVYNLDLTEDASVDREPEERRNKA